MRILTTVLFCLGVWAGCANAQPAQSVPYELTQSSVFTLTADSGEAYDILVSWPKGAVLSSGYPVLYVLDGRDHFAVATETARRLNRFAQSSGVGPGLIVGIDSGTLKRRAKDLTPDAGEAVDRFGREIGGAAAFRSFLSSRVMPEIAKRYPVDATRQHIFGHSYGGLFVLDTLIASPDLFVGYHAASPSIWFGEGHLLKTVSAQTDALSAAGEKQVFLTVGELEQPSAKADAKGPPFNMVELNTSMATALSAYDNFEVTHRILPGDDHGMTSLSTVGWAVRLAFTNRKGDLP